MIELKGVTKRFGIEFAIKNLSFRSEEGEFVAILGPAGVGKSTTLKLCAGILSPNYGEIMFGARVMNKVPPERRNVSMAFENYVLYSHLTNYQNLAFPLRARRVPEASIREQVHQMAALLHIENELDRKPGFLSGGQRQRVALGRCLIRPADLYLLDEPISHLDARLKIQMRSELKKICRDKGSTVLHVTHDYREAMSLADRILVLNDGVLMQNGQPQEVYHRPATEFVARFVGDPPMGLVDVRRGHRDGRDVFLIEDTDFTVAVMEGFSWSQTEGAQSIRIGLRAHDTSIVAAEDGVHTVPGTVYLVESQGHRTLVSVKLSSAVISVRVPPEQRWDVGQRVWLRVDADRLHVFADGKAIHHPQETISTGERI